MQIQEPPPFERVRYDCYALWVGELCVLAVQKERKEDVLVGVCCVGFGEDVGCINADLLLARFEEVIVSGEILCSPLEMRSI
jgi:hypothetical protein